jgi:hypothetical protein
MDVEASKFDRQLAELMAYAQAKPNLNATVPLRCERAVASSSRPKPLRGNGKARASVADHDESFCVRPHKRPTDQSTREYHRVP